MVQLVGFFMFLVIIILFFIQQQERKCVVKLEKLNRDLQLILRSSGDGIFGLNDKGEHTFVNPQALTWLGYTEAELLGRSSHVIWHHSHSDGRVYPEQECPIHVTLNKGEPFFGEEYFWRKDGTGFPVELSILPIRDDGKLIGVIVSFHDITKREYEANTLQASEQQLREVYNAVEAGILIVDARTKRIVDVNNKAVALIGRLKEDLLGQICHLFVCPAEVDQCPVIDCGQTVDHAERVLLSAIGRRDILKTVVPIKMGGRDCLLESFIDITERKKMENALRESKEAAELADQSKSAFLANMSHEIRTPMNAVLGFSQLLQRTELNIQQAAYVRTILSSGQLLMSIVNDVLDLSKIAAGRMVLECVDFEIRPLVAEVAEMSKSHCQSAEVQVKCSVADDIPDIVNGDPTRLKQVLINLMGNAVKFTNHGQIELNVSRVVKTGNSQVGLFFVVKDTGVGIPPDKLVTIFQPFVQADMSTTREYGGTGLGLSISRAIVEAMGGRISAASVLEQGSEFNFIIFLNQQGSQKSASSLSGVSVVEEVAFSFKGLKVLVAEDNLANQKLMRAFFVALHCDGVFAENGRLAVDRLRQEKFDICFMDVQMPVMGGEEAARLIRSEISQTLPIIALTAAMQGDREKILGSGMTDYLAKPISFAQLKEKLRQYAHSQSDKPLL